MTGWQDIETAPRDGTRIRAAIYPGINYAVAYWVEGDLTAGWANFCGRPLSFEPVVWAPLEPLA